MPILRGHKLKDWAIGTLAKVEQEPADLSRLRLRLEPNPTGERVPLLSLPVSGALPIAQLEGALDSVVAEVPGDRHKVRLELLNGAGEVVTSASRTFLTDVERVTDVDAEAVAGDAPPMVAPPPSPLSQLPPLTRQAGALGLGGAQITIDVEGFAALCLLPAALLERENNALRAQVHQALGHVHEAGEALRKGHTMATDMHRGLIDDVLSYGMASARAAADVEIAELKGAETKAPSKAEQAAGLLKQLNQTIALTGHGGKPKPEARPEAKPEARPEARPEVKPEAKPEAEPSAWDHVLSGVLEPEVAAALLRGHLSPEQLGRVRAVAKVLSSLEEKPHE